MKLEKWVKIVQLFLLKKERKRQSGKTLRTLPEAKDWVMGVNVDQHLRFPQAVCIPTQTPHIVIYSLKLSKVILIELTCPAEENIEERHSEKISRYEC